MINQAIIDTLQGIVPGWVVALTTSAVGVTGILAFVVTSDLAAVWIERKLIGRFQIRYGPNRVGPFGLLQPIADAFKLLAKEAITPFGVDKWVYWAAPIVIFGPALLTFAVIPFAPGASLIVGGTGRGLDIGLVFVVAVGSLGVVPIFMAGWASNNKYSLLGAMRAVAQTVSYEIPLVLSVIGIILLAGSLNLEDIIDYQIEHGWFLFLQPLAFIIFFIAGSAELNRTPTDIMEGESEIVAGYHTEYSGFKFSLFYVAEYTHIFAVSAIITTLFLGGWGTGPVLDLVPAVVWLVAKIYLVFCVFVWIRATLPRLRIDQLMGLAWKFLLPLALLNVLFTAILAALDLPGLVFFAANAVLAIGLIVLWTRVLGEGGEAVRRSAYIIPATPTS